MPKRGGSDIEAGRDRPIEITPAMIEAGLYELKYGKHGGDNAYLVRSIFMAMELERLEALR